MSEGNDDGYIRMSQQEFSDYVDRKVGIAIAEAQKRIVELERELTRIKHGVHCQDFPSCRREKHEPFYGVLPCGCTACDCKGEENARS